MSNTNPERQAITTVVTRSRVAENEFSPPANAKRFVMTVNGKPARAIGISNPSSTQVRGDGGSALVLAETPAGRKTPRSQRLNKWRGFKSIVFEAPGDIQGRVAVLGLKPGKPMTSNGVCVWAFTTDNRNRSWYRPV